MVEKKAKTEEAGVETKKSEAKKKAPAKKSESKKVKSDKAAARAIDYAVIRRPVITEKATVLSSNNQVVFVVDGNSTKPQIKAAVENVFDVKVKSVNTIVTKGKQKRFRGKLGKRSDVKKAIITLEAGEQIDVTAGAK